MVTLEERVGTWGGGPTWIGIILYFKLGGEISVHSSMYFILWVFFLCLKHIIIKNNYDQKINKSQVPSASCGGDLELWRPEARSPGRQ